MPTTVLFPTLLAAVFVPQTSITLRSAANDKASVVSVVRLGQECKQIDPPDDKGWMLLNCGSGAGWSKGPVSATAATKESVSAQLKDATDANALVLLETLMTLDEKDAAAQHDYVLRAVKVKRAELDAKAKKKPKPVRQFATTCTAGEGFRACLLQQLEAEKPVSKNKVLFAEPGKEGTYYFVRELSDGALQIDVLACPAKCEVWSSTRTFPSRVIITAWMHEDKDWKGALAAPVCQLVPETAAWCAGAAPAASLSSARQTCVIDVRSTCHTCNVNCASGCNGCRSKCKDGAYDGCAEKCVKAETACRTKCTKTVEAAEKTCARFSPYKNDDESWSLSPYELNEGKEESYATSVGPEEWVNVTCRKTTKLDCTISTATCSDSNAECTDATVDKPLGKMRGCSRVAMLGAQSNGNPDIRCGERVFQYDGSEYKEP